MRTVTRRAAWILPFLALAAGAQIFQWKDGQGKIHYGDQPPADAKARDTKISNIPREPPSSNVEVVPTQLDRFAVRGQSIREIGASMRLSAPVGEEGHPVWGQAHWHIQWSSFTYDTSNGCRVDRFKLQVSTRILMPEWQDEAKGSAELQGKWTAFYRALLVHEEGHRDNGVRAANDLARRIRAIGTLRDCDTVNAEIRNVGARTIGEYRLVDKAYDRTTEHGVTQGAVLR